MVCLSLSSRLVILGKRKQIFSICMAPEIRYKTTNRISLIKRRMENVLEQRGNFPISSYRFSMRFHAYRTYKWKYIYRTIFRIQLSTGCWDIRHGLPYRSVILFWDSRIMCVDIYWRVEVTWSESKKNTNRGIMDTNDEGNENKDSVYIYIYIHSIGIRMSD